MCKFAADLRKRQSSITSRWAILFLQSSKEKNKLAILTAGIQYLSLHKDISPFCGIDFNDLPIEELREALQVVIDELDQR